MSSFYTNFADRFHSNVDENDLNSSFNDYLSKCSKPFDDLIENLSKIIENDPDHREKALIRFLVVSFLRWKISTHSSVFYDEDVENLIRRDLPLNSLKDFVEIFELSNEFLLKIVRTSFVLPMNSTLYKRALNIVVQFDLQTKFDDREILLPLILNSKDHLIDVFLDEKHENEEHLIEVLEKIYENGGKNLDENLKKNFGPIEVKFSRKSLAKFAVRYWNLYGREQNGKYRNLANLQSKRTLGFLISLKYKNVNEEKTMSDECWNELVEDICRDNVDLSEYLIEILADKDDQDAVKFWISQLGLTSSQLPNWIEKYLKTQVKKSSNSITTSTPIEFYQSEIPAERIVFVDSAELYERFAQRLFSNDDEELIIGFDCEWKPLFNQNSSTKQRISVMQIAFNDEIYLLDLLNFFRTTDPIEVQKRLATRLFDDRRVTLLCYGFRSDAAMLVASYPSFEDALRSGQTLVDLSAVHLESETKSNEKGLSELVRLCCGKPLNKSEQCSNWERRPLRSAQIFYAANDAFSLLDVYKFLCGPGQKKDFLSSLRGVRPKKLDLMINRQIDENFQENLGENSTIEPKISFEPVRPSQIKFVVDNMLSGLGRELRVTGCDTIILANDSPHTDAIRFARAENRIILSTGSAFQLLRSHAAEGRCWQPPLNVSAKAQCRATLDHFNVQVLSQDIFSRCTLCNGNDYLIVAGSEIRYVWCKMNHFPLEEHEPDLIDFHSDVIDAEDMTLKKNGVRLALTGLTLKNYRSYDEFYICAGCGKVYWQGSHWRRQVVRNYGEKIIDVESDDSDSVIFYDAEETL